MRPFREIIVFSIALSCVSMHAAELKESLKKTAFKIAYETYVDGNWEIFVRNADGSNPVNLTKTPKEHEMYPQVSPDGKKIAFVLESGEDRATVRSIGVMDIDGKNRKVVADHAREPFWAPDSKQLGFLPQEFDKWNVVDYYTKGMKFYNVETGQLKEHPNAGKLHHLYNPSFAPNGKWIVSTVHAGMGFSHAILAIEANGDKIINLGIPGCRPCVSPDSKYIAWGPGDHELATAELDLDSDLPKVGKKKLQILDKKNKIYHIDWSPDGKYVSFSRGPDGEGDGAKKFTHKAACEMVGVYAANWNILAAPADKAGVIDISNGSGLEVAEITSDGRSNKESDWFISGK